MKWKDRCLNLNFFNAEFQASFFTLLSPSSRGSLVPLHFLPLDWYHLHIWGCWYFSWQSWFQFVIHSAWHFSWCTLPISLNKQWQYLPYWPPIPIWNQFVVSCPVLTVVYWPAYRFLRRQLRWSGSPISLRIFQFAVIHSQRLWRNEAEWMFFWLWKVKVKSLSCVPLFATPRTVAYEAPLSLEFSRQEYWSGLPFPSPGDLPHPGTEPRSPKLQEGAFTVWGTRSSLAAPKYCILDSLVGATPFLLRDSCPE